MKKWTIILGMLIILVGLALIPYWNRPTVKVISTSKQVEKEWTISDYFEKGVNMSLDFQQSYDWSLPQYEPSEDPPLLRKYLQVNVTDTVAKTTTTFKITLVNPRGVLPPALYVTRLEVYSVEVLQHGALTVEDHPKIDPELGINLGITRNNAEHVVTLFFEPLFTYVEDKDVSGRLWIHETFPPAVLRLKKVSTQTDYPYFFLLPVGASLCIVGVILPVWSAKSSKRKAPRRKTSP